MPKRTDIKSIMIIGAGPIVIGQACEFDYSGAQACKALREEGYRVILVNSNPATIMTDPAWRTPPISSRSPRRSSRRSSLKEKPDALLPTMGGQTALNTAMRWRKSGVLERYGVELIGAKRRGHRPRRGPAEIPRRDGGNRHRWARAAPSPTHMEEAARGAGSWSACPRSSAPASPSAAPAAASPITARNSSRSSPAASTPRPPTKC